MAFLLVRCHSFQLHHQPQLLETWTPLNKRPKVCLQVTPNYSFLPKKTLNSPVILSRNSPGGQEKLSTFSRVTITWLGKGILSTIDYWLWNTFLTKCWDRHHFWLSAGTLYSWDREKSFWIWFIYTLEGYVLGCTYFFFEKVYFWNTLLDTLQIMFSCHWAGDVYFWKFPEAEYTPLHYLSSPLLQNTTI